jgi:hypothetical protein
MAIQRRAVSPTTSRTVSAAFRPWVTTWQKSMALHATRLSSFGSFYSEIVPEAKRAQT